MTKVETNFSFSGLFSNENRKPAIILLITPFVLTTFKYYGSKSFYLTELATAPVLFNDPDLTGALYTFLSSFILLGLVPLAIIRFVFRERPAEYGLRLGDIRFGLKALLVLLPVMVVGSYFSSSMPDFGAEYPLYRGAGTSAGAFLGHAFSYLFFYIGWEIYFRGFMQFGLREKFGDWNAILIQTLASCLVHIGKPPGEIYSSILGALVWGVVTFRSRSILYALLTHWVLGVALDFFISFPQAIR